MCQNIWLGRKDEGLSHKQKEIVYYIILILRCILRAGIVPFSENYPSKTSLWRVTYLSSSYVLDRFVDTCSVLLLLWA